MSLCLEQRKEEIEKNEEHRIKKHTIDSLWSFVFETAIEGVHKGIAKGHTSTSLEV